MWPFKKKKTIVLSLNESNELAIMADSFLTSDKAGAGTQAFCALWTRIVQMRPEVGNGGSWTLKTRCFPMQLVEN